MSWGRATFAYRGRGPLGLDRAHRRQQGVRCRKSGRVQAALGNGTPTKKLSTKVCIVGSGPAAHTAAIYSARAELQPLLFEGWMANGIAAGGQLTTTSYVENFPGFPEPILGIDLCDKFRQQSLYYGTTIFSETITKVDFSNQPFALWTESKHIEAETVIIATGAAAKKLKFPGVSDYWQKGISACAVCDGSSPVFRNRALGVIGGGDAAMEEAQFLSRYANMVYIVHRFDRLEASKVMARRTLNNPKIQVIWHHEVLEAYGDEEGYLDGIRMRDNQTGHIHELQLAGLFFAVGHVPATKFLDGQVATDQDGYIVTIPNSTQTSIPGIFAAGDVQDKKWRQAITAAGSGCMAALEAERYLQISHQNDEEIEYPGLNWQWGTQKTDLVAPKS